MKTNKLFTLIRKDIILTLRNKTILLLYALPLIFAIIYPMMLSDTLAESGHPGDFYLLSMITLLGIAAASTSTVGTSIAEEKEKKTMRSLTLSNVNGFEFVMSKIIVMLTLFIIDMTICFFLVKGTIDLLPIYLVLLIFSTTGLLFVGALVGLLAENQQAVGIFAMPSMFLAMAPIFTMSMNNSIANAISAFAPTGPMISMLSLYIKMPLNYEYSYLLGSIVLVAWNVIGISLFAFFFKKLTRDN